MAVDRDYSFAAELWLASAKDPWHFLTLPPEVADEIDERFGSSARGFGSLRVEVAIGSTTWTTSIFPDKKAGSYLLPVKAAVRKAERIAAGDEVSVTIAIRA